MPANPSAARSSPAAVCDDFSKREPIKCQVGD
jgi:hypothetical protein